MEEIAEQSDGDKNTIEKVENPAKKLKKIQKYQQEYNKEWPCLRESSLGPQYVFCNICSRGIIISHGGRDDCRRHITAVHNKYAKARQLKKKDCIIEHA